MCRQRVVVLVGLLCCPTGLAPAQQKGPGPFPAGLVAAWTKAGGTPGSMSVGPAGQMTFGLGNPVKAGDLPAFRFPSCKSGDLRGLPRPDRAFGLDLSGMHFTNPGLKEVAAFKQLQALHLNRTNVTDAGVDEFRKALPDCYISY